MADPAALLKAAWPDGIPVEHYERATAIVLQAIGWQPKPPKYQRVGELVGALLRQKGPMTYEELQRATRLSVGSVSNGIKACGAVVMRRERRKGSPRDVLWYGIPAEVKEATRG